jgi:hypothetical protein
MSTEYVDSTYYSQIVGKLIFLTIIQPDLAYAVSTMSRYMFQPQVSHLKAVKHILRYVKKIADFGILYSCSGNYSIQGYTDAD